jgi:hypothetical protein
MTGFHVVEFRRYTIADGERENFALYFDTYFPEAIQQSGGIAVGQFFEREQPSHFTWIRAFPNTDARGTGNAALYYGPVWKEHRNRMNEHMLDHTNVLLLRTLRPESGVTILPAVDPVRERDGAKGVAIAHIFAVKRDGLDAFTRDAQSVFASYAIADVREAAMLTTLDGPNTWPQHPVRTDGPHLVWIGVARNDAVVRPVADRISSALAATGLLREEPELVILDPTPRSRLRWRS